MIVATERLLTIRIVALIRLLWEKDLVIPEVEEEGSILAV